MNAIKDFFGMGTTTMPVSMNVNTTRRNSLLNKKPLNKTMTMNALNPAVKPQANAPMANAIPLANAPAKNSLMSNAPAVNATMAGGYMKSPAAVRRLMRLLKKATRKARKVPRKGRKASRKGRAASRRH